MPGHLPRATFRLSWSGLLLGIAAALHLAASGIHAAPTTELPKFESRALRFQAGGGIGRPVLTYKEKSSGANSRYESSGIGWTLFGRMDFLEVFHLGADWEAARIGTRRETFRGIGTVNGQSVNQRNDLDIDLDLLDLNLGFALIRMPHYELQVVSGWHFYRSNFTRRNFAFEISDIVLPAGLSPVSEDVRGNGPKLGLLIEANPSSRWFWSGGFTWNRLTSIKADNSALGNINSDGNSIRWRLEGGFRLLPNVALSLQYRGLLVRVNEGRNETAVLPDNETLMHTLLMQLAVRF